MNTIVYVGMDVHKESYTLCCYSYDTDKVEYKQTIPADYKLILKYMEQVRKRYEGEVSFVRLKTKSVAHAAAFVFYQRI